MSAGTEFVPSPVGAVKPYWNGGGIRIYHADSLSFLLNGDWVRESIAAVLTDLPYGVTTNAWDKAPDLERFWFALHELTKPGAPIVTTATQPFASRLIASRPNWFRYEYIWVKTRAANFAKAKLQPMKKHESVLVFADREPIYNPVMEPGTPYKSRTQHPRHNSAFGFSGGESWNPDEVRDVRYPGSVLYFASPRQQDLLHSSQKPVGLYEHLVLSHSNVGDWIVDPYMGSGTTLEACLLNGRNCIGIDSDEASCETAARRLDGFQATS